MKTYRKVNSDLPALLDEWATSLFRELDYIREAKNGVRFKKLYGGLDVIASSAVFRSRLIPVTHINIQPSSDVVALAHNVQRHVL